MKLANPSPCTRVCNNWMWRHLPRRRAAALAWGEQRIDDALSMCNDCILSCRLDAACSIADDARKKDMIWHLVVVASALATHFRVIVTREQDYRLSHLVMVVSFLLLDITVSCEPTDVSKDTTHLNYLLVLSVHNCYAAMLWCQIKLYIYYAFMPLISVT